jgi:hypothetical protein
LRDAVLLTAAGDDPGPAGNLFWPYKRCLAEPVDFPTAFINELADLLAFVGMRPCDRSGTTDDCALQSGRAAPFAAADLIDNTLRRPPGRRASRHSLADLIAEKLKWPKPVPLLLIRTFWPGLPHDRGRGRVRPGEPAFAGAICLALVEAIETALRSAAGNSTSRRSAFGGCAQTANQRRRAGHSPLAA